MVLGASFSRRFVSVSWQVPVSLALLREPPSRLGTLARGPRRLLRVVSYRLGGRLGFLRRTLCKAGYLGSLSESVAWAHANLRSVDYLDRNRFRSGLAASLTKGGRADGIVPIAPASLRLSFLP